MKNVITAVSLAVALVASTSAFAYGDRTAHLVEKFVATSVWTQNIAGVNSSTDANGVVTLTGHGDADKRRVIGNKVLNIPGVTGVRNMITTR